MTALSLDRLIGRGRAKKEELSDIGNTVASRLIRAIRSYPGDDHAWKFVYTLAKLRTAKAIDTLIEVVRSSAQEVSRLFAIRGLAELSE